MRTSEIRAFRRLARRLHRQTGGLLWGRACCSGVTVAQGHVLLELEDMGEATLGRLARALRLDKSTTSRTVDALVTRGFIRKAIGTADRRCLVLALSRAGRDKVAEINAAGDGNARQIFGTIPRGRHRDTLECLSLLVEAGDRVEEEDDGREAHEKT